jgi:hypothetical protein
MNTKAQLLPWKRMALEGGVIVLSILLAFAIDAWWGQRKDHIEDIAQLSRVAAELRLNSEMLRSKTENLQIAIDTTSQFLSWMGPEPPEQELDAVARQLDILSNIGTFSLVRRAADDYLAAGRESTSRDAHIRQSLAEWYFHSDRLENQYTILRTEHWTLNDHLNRIPAAPALKLVKANPIMAKHPESKFPFDQSALLTDPVLESLLANYLIRLEFVLLQALEQQERQTTLLTSIDYVVAE